MREAERRVDQADGRYEQRELHDQRRVAGQDADIDDFSIDQRVGDRDARVGDHHDEEQQQRSHIGPGVAHRAARRAGFDRALQRGRIHRHPAHCSRRTCHRPASRRQRSDRRGADRGWPTAAVIAIASAPQNVTRNAPVASGRAARARGDGAEHGEKDERRRRRSSAMHARSARAPRPRAAARRRPRSSPPKRAPPGSAARVCVARCRARRARARRARRAPSAARRPGARASGIEPAADVDRGELVVLGLVVGLRARARSRVEIGMLGVGLRDAPRRIRRPPSTSRRRRGRRRPAISTAACVASAAATPTIRLAVETMPSFAPSTAARSQPMRGVRWRSQCRGGFAIQERR